jgi:hypothetical protein
MPGSKAVPSHLCQNHDTSALATVPSVARFADFSEDRAWHTHCCVIGRMGFSRRWSAAALVLVAATLLATRAAAQQPYSYPSQSEYQYPAWPEVAEAATVEEGRSRRIAPAAAMTGLSAGVVGAALATYAGARAHEECGLTGCFAVTDARLELTAQALAAAGGGMALVAVPTLLDAMFVDHGTPLHAGRMGWGMALTTLGVGQVASMVVLGVHMAMEEDHRFVTVQAREGGPSHPFPRDRIDGGALVVTLIAQGVTAATHLGVGIPLWANGGRSREEPSGCVEATLVPTGSGAELHVSF